MPTEPPAIGGWYWDTKAQQARFLMPPMPGVDDCVKTPHGWAYRKLAERDAQREQQESVTFPVEKAGDNIIEGWQAEQKQVVQRLYDELYGEVTVLREMVDDFTPGSDEKFNGQVRKIKRLRAAIIEAETKLLF